MKRPRSLIGRFLIGCLVIAWPVTVPALFASGVEFEARLWSPDLAGTASVGNGGNPTAIDLVADLGLADDEVPEGRLVWRPSRRTSVRLSYSSFDFAGDALLERTVTFSGSTFQIDARATSVLEVEYGRFGFAWQPLSTSDGRLRLGPLVEASGLRAEAGISSNVLGFLPVSASDTLEAAFGAAGIVLDAEPSRKLHLYAQWTASIETDEAELTDAEAGLRYYPIDNLALTVGYRRLEINATDGDNLIDLEFDGPFFGGVLRF